MTSPWKYAEDEPLWAWETGGDQAMMFYEPGAPFSPGFPPMTDSEWLRLQEHLQRRCKLRQSEKRDDLHQCRGRA